MVLRKSKNRDLFSTFSLFTKDHEQLLRAYIIRSFSVQLYLSLTVIVAFMRLLRFLKRSTLLRYTLWHTAIMGGFCVLILVLVSQFSLAYIRQHQDLFIFEQLARLKTASEKVSAEDFKQTIKGILQKHKNALIVFKGEQGYYGNLNYLPESVPASPAVGNFLILDQDNAQFAKPGFVKVRGSRITTRWGDVMVAYNAADFHLFSNLVEWALYAAMLLALTAGSLTGYFFSRRLLKRLQVINRITGEVREGALSARVPVTSSQDEFDELASRINAMLDQLEAGMDAIANVTDNIAHDLRTPLSRLRIRLDEHLSSKGANEEQLLVLRSELDTILTTFNAMLELSRLEHSGHAIAMTRCTLNALCEDVVELAEPLAECKGQSIVLVNEGSFTLEGNRDLLFRMLFNVLENAIKYAPDNSTITLTINDEMLTIADQGSGIPAEETDNVFRRLYRLDKSRNEQGFGLGLSLVKAVANLHCLSINLRNEKGLVVALTKSLQ